MNLQKELKDYTFEELVIYCQARITLGIPTGKFNDEIWRAMDLALMWKATKDNKK
jgi:hypothetical protein